MNFKRNSNLLRKPLADSEDSAILVTLKWTNIVRYFGILALCLCGVIALSHSYDVGTGIHTRLPTKQSTVDVGRNVNHVDSPNTVFRLPDITSVAPPRLLFMAASYKMDQFLYLQKTLDVMRDHCNAGWNVTVHLQVAGEFTPHHPRFTEIIERSYCIRNRRFMNVLIENYDEIGFGLNCKHRIFMRDHLLEFDYFSYAEEDMLLTVSHLRAFMHAEAELKRYFPNNWKRIVPGFLRWEDSVVDSERVSWEYFPDKIHVMKMQGKEYIVTNNQNQAIFVFSREQILDLQHRCNYLYDIGQNSFFKALRRAMDKDWKYMSVGVSEWSSSFQHVLQCGVRRVIPVEHFELFMIHHSTNKAQKRRLRKELLTALDWKKIINTKRKSPITMTEYDQIIMNQYNLNLIEFQPFAGKSIWDFNLTALELTAFSS